MTHEECAHSVMRSTTILATKRSRAPNQVAKINGFGQEPRGYRRLSSAEPNLPEIDCAMRAKKGATLHGCRVPSS